MKTGSTGPVSTTLLISITSPEGAVCRQAIAFSRIGREHPYRASTQNESPMILPRTPPQSPPTGGSGTTTDGYVSMMLHISCQKTYKTTINNALGKRGGTRLFGGAERSSVRGGRGPDRHCLTPLKPRADWDPDAHAPEIQVREDSLLLSKVFEAKRSHHYVRRNQEFRADLRWWRVFIERWNGVAVILSCDPPQFVLTSYASGHWGCGAWCQTSWFHVPTTLHSRNCLQSCWQRRCGGTDGIGHGSNGCVIIMQQ